MTQWRPRSPRYEIMRTEGMTVQLKQLDGHDQFVSFPAQLKQISLGGARLITQRPLRLDEKFLVTIAFDSTEFESVVDARVAWARPLRGDDWLMGCEFSPELPEKLLDDLSHHGYIERRERGRILIRTPVNFRHHTSLEMAQGNIVDYSHGGLCLEANVAENLERQLHLVVGENGSQQQAAMLVRWRIENGVEASHLMGCEFVNRHEAIALRQCLESARFAELEA